MNKSTCLLRLAFIAGLFLASAGPALATVTLTGASGGGNISADTASNAPVPAWTTLGAITITEGAGNDFTNGSAVTLVLRVPAGFQFNTAVTPDIGFVASKNITSASVVVTDSSNITVTLTVSGTAVAGDSLTIGGTTGIQVRPTAGAPLASGKHIYRPSTGGGNAGINGITSSSDGSTGSNFGTLTEVAGLTAAIRVETKADGSGTVVGAQNVTAGNSITNYAIGRDAFNNFAANVAADSWSLTGITGGVVSGDLVPAGDSKSAVFTGHVPGSAVIHAPSGSLTATDSGTLTVVPGAPSKLAFTTAAQSLTAGVNSSIITVQIQDAGGNPTNATAARKITLTTTSGSGIFRNLADTATITSITNAIGQNSTNFLYKDTFAGSPTITAASTSPTTLISATQVETVNAANAAMVRVETAADGSGAIVPAQNVTAGNAITVYAITRDAFSNFVANVAADSWSLTGVTGGVLGGDLAPAGDGMSATFTGHVVGTAKVHAPSASLATTDSGTLTVLTGAQTAFRISAANNNPSASANDTLTITAVDQFGNTVSTYTGNHSLTFGGLGTASSGAVPTVTERSGAGGSPINLGTATSIGFSSGVNNNGGTLVAYKAETATLTVTDGTFSSAGAGGTGATLTVAPGSASKLAIASQPSASATAGQAFAQQPVVQIQDAFNNLRNSDTLTVTATRSAGAGTLQGTAAIAAVAGVATYTDLLHQVATNISIAFTSGVLTSVTSSVVAVSAATATVIRVETKADGSGTLVGTQNVTAGNSITNYAITRDAFNNFVANMAADSWSLTGITGGAASGDLVPAGDSKSAVFTGHLAGSAVIHAPAGSLTPTDSGTLTVVPGAPSKLVFTTAPQSLTAGVSSSVITVQIQDVGGNPTNATVARPITLTTTSGSGIFRNLADTVTITSITNAVGQNATNFLYKDTVAGSPTITAATTSPTTLTSATQVEAVSAANAAMIRVETAANGGGVIVPAQNVIAGNTITVYAITRDAFSNFVANAAADSWSLTGVTGGVLGSDLVPAGDGKSAIFNGHLLGSAKVHALSGALTTTDSGILTVVGGPVTQLTFTTQPGNATAGAVFGTQPVVNAQDQFGNNSTNGLPANANISVSLTAGTGPLQGTTITNIGLSGGKGAAGYTNLRIDVTGNDKQLTVTSTNGLASEASAVFTVNPAAATKLVIATQPLASATAGVVFAQQPVIQIQDVFNNLRNADTLTVTATRSAGTGSLQGTAAIAAVAGVASYADLSHLVATNITIAFTSGALTSATSTVVAVSAATPAAVRVETAANGSGTVVGAQNVTAGNAITNYAITRDAFNNFVANVAADSWSLTGLTGGVLSSDLAPAGDSKSAVFTGHLAGSAVIHAPSGSLTPTDSGTLTVVPGAPGKLVFTTAPQSLTAGAVSGTLTVQIQDAGGNPTNATSARTVNLSTSSGGGIFRNAANTATITSIVIAIGQNSTNLLYNDTVAGAPTLTAASPSLVSATQVETVSAANAALVRVETAADGSGAIVPAQNVAAGNAITVYAITRDAFSNFVANAAADSWLLTGVTGGVLSGDLVPAGDGKSAAFNGHLLGSAKVHAPSGALTSTDSGILTVVGGPVTQLTFTTQPGNATAGAVFGTQPVINSQDQFGNNSTNGLPATANITMSLTGGAGPLQGTVITNIGLAGGKGTGRYNNLRIDVAGTDKQLTVTSTNGLTSDASSVFTVVPGAITHYAVSASSPQTRATPFAVTVTALDTGNNTVPDSSTVVTLSSTANVQFDANGDSVFGDNTQRLVNGTCTLDMMDAIGETITVTATDANGTNGASGAITINGIAGDYRSNVSPQGGWNTATNWQIWNGSSWVTASAPPAGGAGTNITIISGDVITNNIAVNLLGTLIVQGTNNFSGSGVITVGSGGVVQNSGVINSGAGTLIFNSGATYQHNFTTTAGAIPTAAWNSGSTCAIIGYTSDITAPGGLGQNFNNFTWNCVNQTGPFNLGAGLTTIGGDFTLLDTGAGSLLGSTTGGSAGSFTLTIGGDMNIQGGIFILDNATSGTGTPTFNLNLGGSYLQTGGTFDHTETEANLTVNFNGANRTFTQSAGTFTTTRMNFNVNSPASLTLNNNFTVASGATFAVNTGGALYCGTNIVSGAGAFSLASGGTLNLGDPNGITASGANGNIQTTTRSFNAAGNYSYYGTTPQVTGSGLTSANNLTITNGSGVTLSGTVTNTGILTLGAGVLTTGGGTMVVSTNGSISGANAASYVNGAVRKIFPTGNSQTFAFPIGDASNYTPINLTSLNVTTAGSLTAKTIASEHPQISGSGINTSADVNRYWTLTNSPAGIVVSADTAAFNFVPADLDGGANTANFVVRRYNGNWTNTVTGSQGATSTSASSITNFGDFAIGDQFIDHYAVTAASPQAAGNAFATTVTAQDKVNQTVPDSATAVTMSASSGNVQFDSNGDTTFGDNTKTLSNGAFTISTRDNVAENFTITATDGNGKSGASVTITNNAAAANTIAFVQGPPASVTAATTLSPAVTVKVTDQFNNLVNGISVNMTLNGGGTLGGTTSQTTTNGIATFSNLSVAQAGSGKTLTASITSPSLSATSDPFTVTPAAAAMLRVETASDGSGTVVPAQNVTAGNSITVYAIARDASANFIANSNATWSLTGITGGVKSTDLAPASGTSAVFTGHWVGSAVIHAVSGSLGVTNSGTLTVVPGAALNLFVTLPGQTFTNSVGNGGTVSNQTAGAAFSLKLTAADQFTNIATSYAGAKTISYSGPGGSPSYVTAVTFTNGQSSNTLTTVLFKAETTNITATDGTLAGIPSSTLTNKPAAYAKLQLLAPGETAAPGTTSGKTGTPNAQTVAVPFGFTVNAVDTNWNVIATNDTIRILSSDAAAALPATNALAAGTQTFNVTFLTAGSQTLTASNVTHTAITANISAAIAVSKGSQTITFNPLADHSYGDAPVALSATASSGLPVTFSIDSGPATISGSTLTITGVGTVTVDASQPGNANWNAATDVQQSFNVAQGNQTITFNALPNYTYGDAPFALSATASSGLAVSFSIVSGPATISGNTLTITGVGTVTVDASQPGNDNWNAATDVQQSFNVAKANQTITFNPLPTLTYGDAPFTLSATASSGLPVTFSVASGPATISGNTLTLTGAGTVKVDADQAGDTNWNPATTVERPFTVNQDSLTVSGIIASNKVYDSTTTATLNTTGAILIGAIGGDDVALNTNDATGAFSDAGVATGKTVNVSGLTLSGTNAGNYNLNQPTTQADIAPAALTITADSTNKVYGAGMTFAGTEFTSAGLAGSDTVGSVTLTSDGTTNTAWVGSYDIIAASASGTGLGNYTISYTNGTLTVTQAVLTVTANNQLRPYGQTNPVFTASYSGFVNDDTTNVLSGSPDLTTDADTNSPVGAYVITNSIGTLSATNYSFVFSNGVLTVGLEVLTPGVTVGDKVYDGTTNATITGYSLDGAIGNDDVSLTNELASFGDRNTGTNKPVMVTGLELAGADAGKYVLATNTVITTASISPLSITASAVADSKTYDGTAASTATPAITAGSVQVGDSAAFTESYDTPSAGTGKTLTPAGSVNDGNGGNNYFVTFESNNNGQIVQASLTIAANNTNKLYGQTLAFAGTEFTAGGLTNGDTVNNVTLTSTGAVATAKVSGSPYAILPGDAVGTGLTNYAVTYVNGALTVNPASLTATVTVSNKIYDGTTAATIADRSLSVTNNSATAATTIWPVTAVPETVDSGSDTNSVELGVKFSSDVSGVVTGIRFYKAAANTGTHIGDLWSTNGALLASVTFTNEGASGWQQMLFDTPVPINSNTLYVASYHTYIGHYSADGSYFSANGADNPPLHAPANDVSGGNGVFTYDASSAFPTNTYGAANYWVDVVFVTNSAPGINTVFGNDDVRLVGGTANFADPNAGTGKTVTVTGLTLAGADAANYGLDSDAATNTADINPAALTVKANDDSKAYDGLPYSGGNGVSYTGFVNHDDATVLAGTPTFSGTSQGAVNAGSYIITSGGLTSTNYSLSFADGSLTIHQAMPTLTWGNPADIGYGTALDDTQLNATANVGGTFVYSPTAGTVLNAGSAQTLGVTFTPTDAINYTPANATAQINVTPAPLTISADALSRGYGATNPVFTAAYNGFVNHDGSGVLTGTLAFSCLDTNNLNVDTNSPVGTYPIVPSGLNAANYQLAYINGTLTVTQALLTVSADNLSRPYGATNPVLTASFTGFVNGQDTNVLSGSPDLSTTADTNSPVATYPIAISLGSLDTNGNYAFNFTNGTLTITAYALTVNIDSQTRPYGQANNPLSGSLTGLQNEDNISASYATSADTNSPTGIYPITVSLADPDGKLSNYTVTTNSGSVTVTPTPLTVKALDDNKTYDALPYSGGNGVSYTGFVNLDDATVLAGSPTFSGSSQGAVNTGSYIITPGGLTSTNYSLSFADGSLTIHQATPTLTWGNPADIGYGTALDDTQLNATANVGGTFVYSPVGGIVLNAGSAQTLGVTFTPTDALNYTPANATAQINVIRASLTVTADNKSKTQGLPIPPLTASYSGFVHGENASVLTTQATLSTTANVDSPVATYPITASGAVADNYSIDYNDGTLTVAAKPALGGISASGNQFTLVWPTVVGQTYQVEYKNSLGDPAWTPLGSPIPGTGNPLTVNDDNNGTSHRFYRLQITQP